MTWLQDLWNRNRLGMGKFAEAAGPVGGALGLYGPFSPVIGPAVGALGKAMTPGSNAGDIAATGVKSYGYQTALGNAGAGAIGGFDAASASGSSPAMGALGGAFKGLLGAPEQPYSPSSVGGVAGSTHPATMPQAADAGGLMDGSPDAWKFGASPTGGSTTAVAPSIQQQLGIQAPIGGQGWGSDVMSWAKKNPMDAMRVGSNLVTMPAQMQAFDTQAKYQSALADNANLTAQESQARQDKLKKLRELMTARYSSK